MLMYVLAIGVMGATAFYVGWNMFSGELEGAAAARLEQSKKKATSALLRLSRYVYRPLVLPDSAQMKRFLWVDMENWRKKNRRMIISAGLEEELDSDDLLAWKIFLGFVVPIFLYIYLLVSGSNTPVWLFGGML